MGGNYCGRQHGCRCAGIRARAITRGPVNIDRPAMGRRGGIGDYERSGIHGCSASLTFTDDLKTALRPVPQVLHGLNSGGGSAPEHVRFPRDVRQIFLPRNSQHGIPDRRRKRRAGAPANDMGALLHVCAPAQIRPCEQEGAQQIEVSCRSCRVVLRDLISIFQAKSTGLAGLLGRIR